MPDAPAAEPLLSLVKIRDRYISLMQAYAQSGGEPSPELLGDIAAFQAQVSAAGAAISGSDARFEAQSTINYWQTVRINAGERPPTQVLVDFDSEAARRQAGDTPPYKGLAPFLTSDNRFFSGRYDLVRRLVDKVKFHRLLALTGLSGSGKSSVVRAGLIPDLADGAYDGIDDNGLTDSATWRFPQPILPGADPLGALEAVYGRIAAPADLPAALDRQGAPVLLSIDQFEEVFTLSPESERRTLFLDALVAAATLGEHRHIVVVTMRSEFDTLVEKHAAFAALFTAGREVIQTMQAADLRKVIEEPANRLGVGFEAGLVDELMTRVQGEPAGLPLLSFTLLKLWEMRDGGPMKMADYQALGGNPRDILANSADKVFEAFLKQDQDLARGVFTRLVKIGDSLEATSMRITRADLDVLGARDNVNRVLDILVDEGLLRTSPAPPERAATDKAPGEDPDSGWWITPETQIEVAHEALIRNWSRLTEWVKDSFAEQTNRKAFTLRAEKWKEGNGDLLSGMSLDEAKDFVDKSPVEAEYVAASRRHFVWRQRRIWGVTAVVAVLAIASSILSFRLIQIDRAKDAARNADTLFETAESLVERGDIRLARKVLLESVPEDADLPQRVQALLQAAELNTPQEIRLQDPDVVAERAKAQRAFAQAQAAKEPGILAAMNRKILRYMADNTGRPLEASLSDDGTAVLGVWVDGKARLWRRSADGRSFEPGATVLQVPGRKITAAALSHDGSGVVSVSSEFLEGEDLFTGASGPTYLDFWRFDPNRPDVLPSRNSRKYEEFQSGGAKSITMHPSEDVGVVGLHSGGIAVVNLSTGNVEIESAVGMAPISTAIFSPRGDSILTAADDGWVEIIDRRTGTARTGMQSSNRPALSAGFSPTGARFAVGSADGIIRMYQTSDSQKLYELAGHRNGVTGLAFSSDGATLVSSSKDGTLRFWELGINAGRLVRTVTLDETPGGARPVDSVVYSADGEEIVAAVADGSLRVLGSNGAKLAGQQVVGKTTDDFVPAVFAISRDRSTLITNTDLLLEPTSRGRTANSQTHYAVIDLASGETRASWETVDASNFYDATLSADGSQLVYSRLDDAKGWQVETRATMPDATPVVVASFKEYPALVAVSPDGKTIIIVDNEGSIRAFDSKGRPAAQPLQPFSVLFDSATLTSIFSTGGPPRFALARSGYQQVSVYDLATGKIIRTIETAGEVASLRFTPNGKGLFVGSDTGLGVIHDVAGKAVPKRLGSRHDSSITFAVFALDGKTLLTGSTDATARLWNVANGALLQVLRGHKATLTAASFSQQGDRLLTESDDRSVMLWDIKTGRQLTVLRGPAGSGAIWGRFGRDGRTVKTLSDVPATVRTWNVEGKTYRYADLQADACKDGGVVSPEERERNALTLVSPLPKCAGVKAKK